LGSSRFRSGALVACALVAVFVVGSTAAADDTMQPTLTIATTPQNPTPGTDVTITATVTPGTNPDSTGLMVSCNTSWALNGSPSAPLDPDASGLVFTRIVTVRSDAAPGERFGSCTVIDNEDRTSSTPYSVTIVAAGSDMAPTITSHTPADGEADVAVDANIGITFSEPVDVRGAWFSIVCGTSGTHTAGVTGSTTAYVFDPGTDFDNGEQCTVSLDSTLVTDSDANDPPDDLSSDTSWSFTTVEALPTPNERPSVSTSGPYTVDEGGTVSVSADGLDPEGGVLAYAWDLDGNGSFETSGQTVSFSADDGLAVQNIAVRVTDAGGLTATDATRVTIANVAPTATLAAPASADAGFAFALSLTSAHDPSGADTSAGLTYAFDCGGGFGAFGSASAASCPTTDVGTLSVGAKIRDKDGGVTTYTATVDVVVTLESLCDLVRAYSTDPKVADDLCAKLAQAEDATTATSRTGNLGAFRNQIDAKGGRALTADQAAELKLLSTRL
jgi:hypothetical protein